MHKKKSYTLFYESFTFVLRLLFSPTDFFCAVSLLFAVSLFLFLWVLLAEDYKEPEAAFKKVTWDKVGFEDYFLNRSTSAQIGSSECWEVRVTSVKSRGVLNHLQSFDSSCSYFVFLNQLQSLSCLLQYTREVDSRILYAVQDNWML